MESEYYIFKILLDGTPVWIERAGDIEEAAKIVFTLEQTSPGPYVVYDLKPPSRPCFRIEAAECERTTIGTAIGVTCNTIPTTTRPDVAAIVAGGTSSTFNEPRPVSHIKSST
jgi:hypothetical protein